MLHLTSLAVLITTLRVGIAANDPYFNTTVLLLNGDVTPFTDDASTNKFELNPFGAPSANKNNPLQADYYSMYFNGSTDYLSVPSSADFTFGTGDFTVEAWIYATATYAVSPGNAISGNYIAGAGNDDSYWVWGISATGTVYFGGRFTTLVSTSAVIPVTSWAHVAVSRQSGTSSIFINGTLYGTSTTVLNLNSAATMYVGAVAPTAGFANWPGYISNFRVVKGTAVYTGSFTPSTAPLTATQSSSGNIAAITGTATSLLTGQRNSFIDTSSTPRTITASGTPSISVTQPFILPSLYSGYGSGLFNGSSDYLVGPVNNSKFQLSGNGGTGFTIEAWVYPTTSGVYKNIASYYTYTDGDIEQGWLFAVNASNQLRFKNTFAPIEILGGTILPNIWTHVAGVVNGGYFYLYVNGVSVGTPTVIGNQSYTGSTFVIGALKSNNAYTNNVFTGYISNLRVNNTAVYTGAFTPPTAPLSRIQSSGTNIAALTGTETVLLTLQNNQSQNNNQFRDSSSSNFTITRSGTPTQGTFTPFSQTGWSGYFDGVGGTNINLASNSAFALGTGQYFIQAFCYPLSGHSSASGNTTHGIISQGNNANNLFWAMGIDPTTGTIYWGLTGAGVTTSVSYPVLFNSWNHIAVSRDASNIERIFLNGRLINQRSNTTNFNGVSDYATRIGSYYDSNYPGVYGMNAYGQVFYGYISNIQMVVGNIPTYFQTASITPGANIFVTPIAPATVVTGTVLLTLQNNYFKDNSANAFAIVMSGSPKIQAFSPFAPTAAYSTTLVGGSMYFNGTSDSLTVSGTINLSGTDWTIETWIYPTSAPAADNTNILQSQTGTNNWIPYLSIGLMLNGRINVTLNAANYTTTQTISFNNWNHLALVRSGGIVKLYISGVASSVSVTVDIINSNFSYWIGKVDNSPGGGSYIYYFPGYLSNLRIVKGLAVYTSAFTPPTAPLAASVSVTTVSQVGVDFLVVAGGGSGGYCGNGAGGGGGGAGGVRPGASVVMASNVSYTIIVGGGGSSSASGTNSSFHTYTALGGGRGGGWDQASHIASTSGGSGGGAGYGNSNAYSSSSATAPELGNRGGSGVSAGPYPGGGGGGASAVGGDAPNSSVGGAGGAGYTSTIAGSSSVYGGGGGAGTYGGTAGAGGTGGGGAGVASSGTGFSGTANTGGGGGGSTAGGFYGSPGGTGGSGIVIIRYSVDSPAALSTTNANVTIAGGYRIYTWITSGNITFDTFATGVSTTVTTPSALLLSGTNTGIQDATGKNTLTTVGDVRVSTAVKKYGTGAMYFDGTGDWLNSPNSLLAIQGSEAFTLEAWIYPTSVAGDLCIYETRGGSGWVFFINSSGKLQVYDTTATLQTQSTATLTVNTWTHVALVRVAGSSTVTYYVNGIAAGTFTLASFATATQTRIGARNDGAATYVGYIDDLRITKYARYTTAFVPPSASLPVL